MPFVRARQQVGDLDLECVCDALQVVQVECDFADHPPGDVRLLEPGSASELRSTDIPPGKEHPNLLGRALTQRPNAQRNFLTHSVSSTR